MLLDDTVSLDLKVRILDIIAPLSLRAMYEVLEDVELSVISPRRAVNGRLPQKIFGILEGASICHALEAIRLARLDHMSDWMAYRPGLEFALASMAATDPHIIGQA